MNKKTPKVPILVEAYFMTTNPGTFAYKITHIYVASMPKNSPGDFSLVW